MHGVALGVGFLTKCLYMHGVDVGVGLAKCLYTHGVGVGVGVDPENTGTVSRVTSSKITFLENRPGVPPA